MMIHTYAWLAAVVVFLSALYLSKLGMLRLIGMHPGHFTNCAALLYALGAVLFTLQVFAIRWPTEFLPNYGLFGLLALVGVIGMLAFGVRSKKSVPIE
ncbi:hypothetical protein BH11PAT2_BH11PAT2_03430 [soil metagenome]